MSFSCLFVFVCVLAFCLSVCHHWSSRAGVDELCKSSAVRAPAPPGAAGGVLVAPVAAHPWCTLLWWKCSASSLSCCCCVKLLHSIIVLASHWQRPIFGDGDDEENYEEPLETFDALHRHAGYRRRCWLQLRRQPGWVLRCPGAQHLSQRGGDENGGSGDSNDSGDDDGNAVGEDERDGDVREECLAQVIEPHFLPSLPLLCQCSQLVSLMPEIHQSKPLVPPIHQHHALCDCQKKYYISIGAINITSANATWSWCWFFTCSDPGGPASSDEGWDPWSWSCSCRTYGRGGDLLPAGREAGTAQPGDDQVGTVTCTLWCLWLAKCDE